MRAVVTRVKEASVSIDGAVTGEIGRGFLVLLGVGPDDGEEEAKLLKTRRIIRVARSEFRRERI